MRLIKCLLTENECYKIGRKIQVKGVMVHSTAANNTTLKRYVQPVNSTPDKDNLINLLGKNLYNNHWNQFRPSGNQVCVHGFIGTLADGSIATVQTLPWDIEGWHSGSGNKGNANKMGYIGFEICEDNLTNSDYFNKVYKEAVELVAYLCKEYNLNPLEDGVVICHSEGYKRGIASNHGDVMHWFPKFGRNMDTFRVDVANKMKSEGFDIPSTKPDESTSSSSSGSTLKVGDYVRLNKDAVQYNGNKIRSDYMEKKYELYELVRDRAVISIGGVVIYAVNIKYLEPWENKKTEDTPKDVFKPYLAKVTVDALDYRSGPGASYKVNGTIRDHGTYTIVEEKDGYGRLKSDAGWILLNNVKFVRYVE